MAWRDAGLEIVIAIIGSSLLGTSLSTYYNNVYYQPFIDISLRENQNYELSDPSDYYEITFKNTGQKSASNLQINIFFFANITNYIPMIHGEKPIFNLDNNISQNGNNLIKPSVLNASISKFPENGIIILYVWTDPWPINKKNFIGIDEYYIIATYDEGSNHKTSFFQKNINDQNSFFPYIEIDTSNTLSIQNVPFVTILLSILTFAILFKVHRTKLKNKLSSINRLDHYQINEEPRKFQYDLIVLVPIIFVSSTMILFTIEIPLQNIIFSFVPPYSLDLQTYSPINSGEFISEDRYLPFFLILLFSFFGTLVILIIRSIVTYVICILILKYVINVKINLSFRLGEGINKKLFLLSLIIMSFPVYTIIYSYSLDDVFYSYNNLLYFIILVEFIRLGSLLMLNKIFINKNTLVTNLRRISRVFCFTSGTLYIIISIIISNEIMDIYSINIPLSINSFDQFSLSTKALLENLDIHPILLSLLFFFVVGIIQISWAYLLRKKTNGILYGLEFAGLVILTIIWLSLRVFLPLAIANPTNSVIINYFAFLDIVYLILNLGTIILCLNLITILIDYLIIKKESILLKIKKSRISNPKLVLSLLSIIIIFVLVPIIFFIPYLTEKIFYEDYFFSKYHYNIPVNDIMYFDLDKKPLFVFNPNDKSFYQKSEDCIMPVYMGYELIHSCIQDEYMHLIQMDVDPIKKELILLLRNDLFGHFYIGIINLTNYDVNNFALNFYRKSQLDNINMEIRFIKLNASAIDDMKINHINNNMYILHDTQITEVNMNTYKSITLLNLTNSPEKFAIDLHNEKIFLLDSRGLDIIDINTKKQLSHIDLNLVVSDILYDYNNKKLYLLVPDPFKTYLYIIDPSSYTVKQKLEIDGYPLNIGTINDSKFPSNNRIFLLAKGPDGIREFGIDDFGDIHNLGFYWIPSSSSLLS